ncbi:Maf family protein, partial [Brevundimonas sp.]|uniref:Maf family protein n=1 Tax=Brevundimonas sp. TaxID=1871086 RepID=UPI002ABC40BE
FEPGGRIGLQHAQQFWCRHQPALGDSHGIQIAAYVASGDWRGKAGGYGIQGPAGAFVRRIVGSHPAVMGLPLYETVSLLSGIGWQPNRP